MAVLVDSNVILDVATNDPTWGPWSSEALARAADEAVLVINPIVFAEVSVGFERVEDLEDALPHELYRRDPLPYEAAFLAGRSFLAYRRRGGRRDRKSTRLNSSHQLISYAVCCLKKKNKAEGRANGDNRGHNVAQPATGVDRQ